MKFKVLKKRMHHMMVDTRGWVYNELGVAQVPEEVVNEG